MKSRNFRVQDNDEKFPIVNPNIRHILYYYQHALDDYQSYTIETDGAYTIEDVPVKGTAMAQENVPGFIQLSRNGTLYVHVTDATWVKFIYHMARPGIEPYDKAYLLIKTAPTVVIPPATERRYS